MYIPTGVRTVKLEAWNGLKRGDAVVDLEKPGEVYHFIAHCTVLKMDGTFSEHVDVYGGTKRRQKMRSLHPKNVMSHGQFLLGRGRGLTCRTKRAKEVLPPGSFRVWRGAGCEHKLAWLLMEIITVPQLISSRTVDNR